MELFTTALTLFALGVCTAVVDQAFQKKLPNGENVPDAPGFGHTDPDGYGARNAFGKAFSDAGLVWAVAFCQADSDGDGQTNGQELGDPCCESTAANKKVLWNLRASNPADATKTSDPMLWSALNCSMYPAVTNTTTSSAVGTRSGAQSAFVLVLLSVLIAVVQLR